MVIAVDFDLTLCSDKPEPGYRMGVPEPGAVSSVRRLVNAGHTVIIFTARNVNKPESHKAVADWLDYFKIPHHGITNIKQVAFDVMIDDKALHFDSWPQTMLRLTKLQNTVQSEP